jgi:hypothetical protein
MPNHSIQHTYRPGRPELAYARSALRAADEAVAASRRSMERLTAALNRAQDAVDKTLALLDRRPQKQPREGGAEGQEGRTTS